MSPTNSSSPVEDPIRVLVIDDEKFLADTICESLSRHGYDCVSTNSGKEGLKRFDSESFDIVMTDIRLGDMDGLTILKKIDPRKTGVEVIVFTGSGDKQTVMDAWKEGAAKYLEKPLDLTQLRNTIDSSAEKARLTRSNRELRQRLEEKFGYEGVIGNSPKMHDVINRLKAYAGTRATVLILGENGSGKELAAKALHVNSPRKSKPFVAMNCAALNENLLDDEMFGHEPGAFTGADKLRKGRFEYANGGTLFLDEVGDMPMNLQAKLLRVLENGEVSRIGSNDSIKVDVRLVAATNRNLETMIADGKFRQDLYFRLKVGTVRLPALRERREDIPLLSNHFIKEMNQRHNCRVTTISDAVKKAFATYNWPGNVRELRNIIESMVVQDHDGTLGMDDLQDGEPLKSAGHRPTGSGADTLIGRPISEVERYYMERALELADDNREVASKMLGIGERTLYRMITDWKLQDRIKDALNQTDGDIPKAAAILEMKPDALEKKLKKFGQTSDEE